MHLEVINTLRSKKHKDWVSEGKSCRSDKCELNNGISVVGLQQPCAIFYSANYDPTWAKNLLLTAVWCLCCARWMAAVAYACLLELVVKCFFEIEHISSSVESLRATQPSVLVWALVFPAELMVNNMTSTGLPWTEPGLCCVWPSPQSPTVLKPSKEASWNTFRPVLKIWSLIPLPQSIFFMQKNKFTNTNHEGLETRLGLSSNIFSTIGLKYYCNSRYTQKSLCLWRKK